MCVSLTQSPVTIRVSVSPFAQQLEGHEGEDEDAEHEEQEDGEDLRKSVPDAPERSAELNTNKHTVSVYSGRPGGRYQHSLIHTN